MLQARANNFLLILRGYLSCERGLLKWMHGSKVGILMHKAFNEMKLNVAKMELLPLLDE